MKIRVIPVLDIKEGIVVKAERGNREFYKPLSTIICDSNDPVDIAKAYQNLGFCEIYVADLDAINKGKINYNLLNSIRKIGLKTIADIGIKNKDILEKLKAIDITPVLATESIQSLNFLESCMDYDIIFSIDTKRGVLLNNLGLSLNELIEYLKSKNKIREYILLDLYEVGAEQGPNLELCKRILEKLNGDILYGGGVGSIDDIITLEKMGLSGVLVGSVIHSGRLDIKELFPS